MEKNIVELDNKIILVIAVVAIITIFVGEVIGI
jgi:hypothetical protein